MISIPFGIFVLFSSFRRLFSDTSIRFTFTKWGHLVDIWWSEFDVSFTLRIFFLFLFHHVCNMQHGNTSKLLNILILEFISHRMISLYFSRPCLSVSFQVIRLLLLSLLHFSFASMFLRFVSYFSRFRSRLVHSFSFSFLLFESTDRTKRFSVCLFASIQMLCRMNNLKHIFASVFMFMAFRISLTFLLYCLQGQWHRQNEKTREEKAKKKNKRKSLSSVAFLLFRLK